MKNNISRYITVLLFTGLGLATLFLVYYYQNAAYQADCALKGVSGQECNLIDKLLDDLNHVNYSWIWITIIMFMISNVMRAYRWKMMLEALGYKPRMVNLFSTVMVNYLANLGIPRSGELVRAALISKYDNIPVEKAFGTVVTDRIFDVIMMAIVFGMTALLGGKVVLDYLDQNINIRDKAGFLLDRPGVIIAFIILILLATYFVFKNRTRLRNTTIGSKLMHKFKGFYDGVISVKNVANLPLFIFHTVMIWILYFLMQYLAFFSFAPTENLGPIAGLVVFAFGSLGIVVPTPGGMGSFHFLTTEALAIYNVQGADAFTYANIVFFSIQIFANIVFGIISLVLLSLYNKVQP
ncbi:MAG TPA: lysylphosphatidylglycerol synthase transmembrane domain-containing protein [Saprospiraceae bacterium]|jgi:uncharacterized protein (TIRG00374 family)|nr:flippase-like domain-containing protein [Saprospiraceae bacterium]HRO08063.1 lysylphosphatidylglycerol synthase transmembrane domain-containing protein [Saprospiraceae bacterium]HRP41350.1 lysylphosphatidylglycerol synthase transmembrane domain-containing protein [Saprospiraceae bacterium]